jgi:predicted HTH transcriptional regulator
MIGGRMEKEHADVSRVLSSKGESKRVDLKSTVDLGKPSDFCELVKDIIAMTNSGGGTIVFGADNKGKPVESDISSILNIDPAKITDKIARHTSSQFDNFQLVDAEKEGKKLAIMIVGACGIPMVFTSSGTYTTDDGR